MFVILLVIVTFSNQLWRGHHLFYNMLIRWSIIIILLQKVIVFENIFIWYNIGAINYCYNTQITVFSKLKTKQNKTWKKRTTFSGGLLFHVEDRCYNTLKGRLFFAGLKFSIVKHENAMQISVSKNRLWPLRWHDTAWPQGGGGVLSFFLHT